MGSAAFFTEISTRRPRCCWASDCHIVFWTSSKTLAARRASDAARRAAEAIRGGGGPSFLELRTYRFRAHSMYDPDRYRDKGEVARWKERDPIPAFVARCGIADDDIAAIERDAAAEIDTAVAFAEAGTPEPVEDLTRFVTSEPGRT